MYVTDRWQSLDMLQAGVDRNTADYYMDSHGFVHYLDGKKITDKHATEIPVWSFGRMWSMMNNVGVSYEYCTVESLGSVMCSMVDALCSLAKQKRI